MASASRGPKLGRLVSVSVLASLAAACGGGGNNAPSGASIVALVREWYAQSNPAICSQLTDNLLQTGWQKSGDAGRQACRAELTQAKPEQAVVVEEPGINGSSATVKVDYTRAGKRYADELQFVLVNGAWLADSITPGLTPTPAPSQTPLTAGAVTQAGSAATATQTAPTTAQTSTAEATTQARTAPTTTETTRSSTGTLVPPPPQILVAVKPVGSSHESGTAVFRSALGGSTFVTVLMKHAPRGASQAAAIVRGSCAAPGAVVYQLNPVSGGASGKTLTVGLASFRGAFAVVVHTRGAATSVASCGDLPRG